MPKRVRRHALAFADARRGDVVADDLAELGVVERLALDADEERLLDQRHVHRVVRGEEWRQRRMDRHHALTTALRLPHVQEPSREVDVVPGKPEQLAPAQAGVGEEGKQEPVAFGLPRKCRSQMSPRSGAASSRSSSVIVSTSGSASRFFGVRNGRAGSRSSRSSSTRKRKNDFSAAVARAWLEGAGRRVTSSARKARRCVGRTSARSSNP